MSDKEQTGGSHEGDVFSRFLEVKQINYECPVCATKNWSVLTSNNGAKHLMPSASNGIFAQLFYILFCLNCGFSRMHLADVVEGSSNFLAFKEMVLNKGSEGT